MKIKIRIDNQFTLKIGSYFLYFSINNTFPTRAYFIDRNPKGLLGKPHRLKILEGVLGIFFFYVLKFPRNYDPIKEIERTNQEYLIAKEKMETSG